MPGPGESGRTASADELALLARWNATDHPFSEHLSICDLFAAAVRRGPDRPAVIGEDGEVMTYAELDARSEALARLLARLGQGRGRLVPVLTSRTPAAVAAFLAVLKCGAAYVPVDPAWPRFRLMALLRQVGPDCILAGRAQVGLAMQLAGWTDARRHLVLFDTPAVPGPEPLDIAGVTALWDDVARAPDEATAAGFNYRPASDAAAVGEAEVVAYRDRVLQLVGEDPGELLEVGCGSGLILKELARRTRCVGIDPSPVAVARVRAWAEHSGAAVTLVQGFAHDAAERIDRRFDTILLASVAHFFPGPFYLSAVLAGLARMLRPGGRIVIADLPGLAEAGEGHLLLTPELIDDLARTGGMLSVCHAGRQDEAPGGPARRRDVVLVRGGPVAEPSLRIWTMGDLAAGGGEAPRPAPTDLAYVIFTSGSTGEPKGVEVTHRPVVNVIEFVNRRFGIGTEDRVLFLTAFAFDLSVYDMFGILAAGASLQVASEESVRDPDRLIEQLWRDPITIWDSAPAALQALIPLAAGRPPLDRPDFKVLLSGDWVRPALIAEVRRTFGRCRIYVLGGATEATIWSNWFEAGERETGWPSIPYGVPIQNARYHVLDAALRPCPLGVEGDLHIAGACLAQGYHHDAALTSARFVADPSDPRPGARMYATGDRAIWHRDGLMEFRGRRDGQVKIRGHRVELGEVEAVLASMAGVADCVALATGEGATKRLAAFARVTGPVSEQGLRDHLRARLPAYAVPDLLRIVERFPVGPNGKTDRAALAATLDPQRGGATPPHRDAARTVRAIWDDLLGAEAENADPNFFEAGGHSLLAIQLVGRLRGAFSIEVTVREIFDGPLLSDVATLVAARLVAPGAGA